MIVGNKVDQEDSRKVSIEEGKAFAAENQALFLETSAKTAVGVESAFEDLVRRIMSNPFLHTYFGAGSIKRTDVGRPNVVTLGSVGSQRLWYQRCQC
jgi:Ras-related protein Rab-18